MSGLERCRARTVSSAAPAPVLGCSAECSAPPPCRPPGPSVASGLFLRGPCSCLAPPAPSSTSSTPIWVRPWPSLCPPAPFSGPLPRHRGFSGPSQSQPPWTRSSCRHPGTTAMGGGTGSSRFASLCQVPLATPGEWGQGGGQQAGPSHRARSCGGRGGCAWPHRRPCVHGARGWVPLQPSLPRAVLGAPVASPPWASAWAGGAGEGQAGQCGKRLGDCRTQRPGAGGGVHCPPPPQPEDGTGAGMVRTLPGVGAQWSWDGEGSVCGSPGPQGRGRRLNWAPVRRMQAGAWRVRVSDRSLTASLPCR